MKKTPWLDKPSNKYEVIVFGSNLQGYHGAGAAKLAFNNWGAKWNQGSGLFGQSYSIPTVRKLYPYKVLMEVYEIKYYVDILLETVKAKPNYTFYITPIGTGLGGKNAKDIAPLFKDFMDLPNVTLPEEFINVLTESNGI